MTSRRPLWKEHLWGPPTRRKLAALPESVRPFAAGLLPGKHIAIPDSVTDARGDFGDFILADHHSDYFLRHIVALLYIPRRRDHPFWWKSYRDRWDAIKCYHRRNRKLKRREASG